jgi:hypothetical protein
MNRLLCSCALLALASPSALAQGCGADGPILTRTDLLARLGSSAVIEGFETFSVPAGIGVNLDIYCMDSTSIANGQGPGLVQSGAQYCDPSGTRLQWNGDQYFQRTTQTLMANGTGGEIRITYTQPVAAMGFDLDAFYGYPYSGTATIYDTATNVVGTVNFALTTGGSERFFVGFAHAAGIGRVDIVSSAYSWSPKLDDHAYGVCSGGIGAPYCFGDDLDPLVTTDCPCSNFGAAGHGCANAVNSQGARLTGSGSTSPDTAQLTSTGELNSSLSIFLQGTTTTNAGLLFGDGVRCVSGSLKRLYVHNAVGGSVTAPSGSDLSITARSAQLGAPIPAGAMRYYQVYYRDPNLGFCSGLGYNISNAQPIQW